VVHGSAGPGSDLDLLVDCPNSPSFEQFMDLKLAPPVSAKLSQEKSQEPAQWNLIIAHP
jgi:hypothetical protein